MKYPRLSIIIWVYGLAVLAGCFAAVLVTMLFAGLNDYSAVVVTNNWGEHYVELFMLVSGMICFVYGSKKIIRIGVEKKI